MPEKRGRVRVAGRKATEPPPVVALDDSEPDSSLPESQIARLRLRQRWELASVLNFLHVFKELMGRDLKISAEGIETALITPNDDLAQIHIVILKGIPPVTKNLMDADEWVKVVSKELATWWPWVAEGENPLKADHGEEIARYKELDPTARLLVLKALCEVRALQDDVLRYITDALKTGTPITAFRKERIGCAGGIAYWYDGNPVFGYRLYREITIRSASRQKLKGNGCSAQPTIASQWETLATNLVEFWEISDNLSSSKIMAETAVGEFIKTDIIPVLDELQKKKERALKRKQRQTRLLDGFLNSMGKGIRHSQRERKPVKYTFDDYDQSIEEAIQITKNSKMTQSNKDSNKRVEHGPSHEDIALNGSIDAERENSSPDEVRGSLMEVDDNGGHPGRAGDDDDVYDDGDGSNVDHVDENGGLGDSNEEDSLLRLNHVRPARKQKDEKGKVAVGLRRSRRTAASTNGTAFSAFHTEAKGHVEMKKRLRERPTRNADCSITILSDSEDFSSSESNEQTEAFPGPESEPSTSATGSDEPQNCSKDDGSDGDDGNE